MGADNSHKVNYRYEVRAWVCRDAEVITHPYARRQAEFPRPGLRNRHLKTGAQEFWSIYQDAPIDARFLVVIWKGSIKVIDFNEIDLDVAIGDQPPPIVRQRFKTLDQAIAYAIINL